MRFRGEIEASDRIRTIEVKVAEAYSVAVSAKAPTADRRVVAKRPRPETG